MPTAASKQDNINLHRALVDRGGLRDFIRLAWPLVEPRKFIHNWHIDCVAEHLEAVNRLQIRNLLINIPPGSGKSLIVSVFWPTYTWIKSPGDRWIYASYDLHLSQRDGRRQVDLMQSDWFKARWPELKLAEKNPGVTDFWNTAKGFRYGTSVLGPVTGRHADTRVVDDPNKPLEDTKNALERAVDWHDGTLATRIADPKTSRFVCMMQRLHDMDLSGVLESRGGYEVLRLPMEYERGRACVTVLGSVDVRTEEGELLDKFRHDEESLKKLKSELKDPNKVAAQLQQNPVPEGGAIFDKAWLQQEWDVLPKRIDMWFQSWDMTFKDEEQNDFVAGGVWAVSWPNIYLVHIVNARLDFPKTCDEVEAVSKKFPRAVTKLVEDKANGPAVIATLKKRLPGFVPIQPEGGKISRANAAAPYFRGGNVFLPKHHIELTNFRQQLQRFPKGSNDDLVDMTSQAITWLEANKSSMMAALIEAAKNGTMGDVAELFTGAAGTRDG